MGKILATWRFEQLHPLPFHSPVSNIIWWDGLSRRFLKECNVRIMYFQFVILLFTVDCGGFSCMITLYYTSSTSTRIRFNKKRALSFGCLHLDLDIFIRSSLDGTYYAMALSVRPFVRPSGCEHVKHRRKQRIIFKFGVQVCLGVPSINLWFVWSYHIKYAQSYIISEFSIFGIPMINF